MPTKCVRTTVQYCCLSAIFSVALRCHVGAYDSRKGAITSGPVDRILIHRSRLDSFQPSILIPIAEWDIPLQPPYNV